MKDKVVVHGSYFGDNFGDRLFIEMFIDWLADIEEIDKNDIVLPFANNRIRESVKCSKIKGIKAILRGKCFVYTGGGYFGEFQKSLVWNARLIIRHLLMALFSIITFKPLIIIGVGAGPLSNPISRRLVTFVCNHAKKVIVRDRESFDYMRKYGVKDERLKLSVDSVLGLDISKTNETESESIKIGVHVFYPYENKDIINVIKDIKAFADSVQNYEIVYFMDLYKEGFTDFSESVIDEVMDSRYVTKVKYENPEQLIELIGSFDVLFTIKLHVGIVALTQGVKTYSIAVHHKTKRLYNQLNLSDYTTELKNYQQGKILEMTRNWKEVSQTIPVEIQNMADENRRELKKFIRKYYLS